MEVEGKAGKVLLRDVQMHPFKQRVLHIDFQRVDAKTRLRMKVPLHYANAEESQAVKFDNCVVNHVVSELDVSCLPADLPEFIEVDLSGLKKGMTLHLADVKLPKGVTVLTRGKLNPVLVSVVALAGEEVAEPGAVEAAAPAAAADAKAAPAAKGGEGKGDAKGGDAKAAPAAKAPAAKSAKK
jgi:large subunit ribosomal protein L25